MPKLSSDHSRWLLTIILGLVLLIFARALTKAVGGIIAVGMILAGAAGLISWWQSRDGKGSGDMVSLVGSAIILIFGVWALLNLTSFTNILRYVAGGLLILFGAQRLYTNRKTFALNAVTITAGISLVLGIIVLFTKSGLVLPVRILGIGLIINGASGALDAGRS